MQEIHQYINWSLSNSALLKSFIDDILDNA